MTPAGKPVDPEDCAALGLSIRRKSRGIQAEILKQLKIKSYKTDLLKWSKADLLAEFGLGKKPKNINKSLFIKNVIWQTFEKLQTGAKPFDIGNIRSFWYYIKDTMDRVGANKKGDPYNTVSDMFVTMVRAGLFQYKDFGFEDDDKGNRWLGGTYSHIILFAEKTSYTDLLREINQDFDITTIAAGGQASCLSIEYFVREIKESGVDLGREFIVFSVVDFDPAGDIIVNKFVENAQANGIKNFKIFPGKFSKKFNRKDLVIPENMTKEQKARVFRLPLNIRQSGQAAAWANTTGGVDGMKNPMWGIETIVMPKAQLREIFEKELAEVVTIDPEPIAKRRALLNLNLQLKDWTIKKLQAE
jgi:hypothetical protein